MSIWNKQWAVSKTTTIGNDEQPLNNPTLIISHLELSNKGQSCAVGLLCQEAGAIKPTGRIFYIENEGSALTESMIETALTNEFAPDVTVSEIE